MQSTADVIRRRALARILAEGRVYLGREVLLVYSKAMSMLLVIIGGLWWAVSSVIQYTAQPGAAQMAASEFSQALSWLPVPSLVAIALAIAGLVANEWLKRRNERVERQRRALSEWLEKLHTWSSNASNESSMALGGIDNYLTNRHAIELSLRRQDRYLAWWMSEMALGMQRAKCKTTLILPSKEGIVEEASHILDEIGESISAWHYRELKTSDFYVPYTIRRRARMADVDVDGYATTLGLQGFVVPGRFTKSKQDELARIFRARPEVLSALDAGMLASAVFDLQAEEYADRIGRIIKLHLLRVRLWFVRKDFKSVRFISTLLKSVDETPAQTVKGPLPSYGLVSRRPSRHG